MALMWDMPHQCPVRLKIPTPRSLVHPWIVIYPEEVGKSHICVTCPLCNGVEVFICWVVLIYIQAVLSPSHNDNMMKSLSSFPTPSTFARGAFGLKILQMSNLVPRFSWNVGPIPLPWLLPSNTIFSLFHTFLHMCWLPCPFALANLDSAGQPPMCLFLAHWICFSVGVGGHHEQRICSPTLEFLGLNQSFKSAFSAILLLPITAFSFVISCLVASNSCSRYLVLSSCCIACFWYLHDYNLMACLCLSSWSWC